MKKEELIKKIGELEEANRSWNETDEFTRKNISQFLGSFKDVKVYRWSEIYFEIGKLIESNQRTENLSEIKNNIQYLLEEDKKAKETKK